MAIPDYQSCMLPLLQTAADGNEHNVRETTETLAELWHLTPKERQELIPSGRQAVLDNRLGWAKVYLAKAGLLELTGRAKFRITPRGRDVLKQNVTRIDASFLRQFPEFVAFQGLSKRLRPTPTQNTKEIGEGLETPEELLEDSYQNLRKKLAVELVEHIKKCPPAFFEKLVVELLVAMGYGGSRKDAGQALGRTGDGGIDGIIKEDKLGLDVVYLQAKRWDSPVGRPVVQAFTGSLEGQRAQKGVLIATSQFTQEAKEYVERIGKKVVLIDGDRLADLMIDHGIGVTEVTKYEVKKLDLDYFGEE